MDPVDALGFIKVQVHGDLGGSRRSSSPTFGIPRLATDDGRRRALVLTIAVDLHYRVNDAP